jgi:hypothetical protein
MAAFIAIAQGHVFAGVILRKRLLRGRHEEHCGRTVLECQGRANAIENRQQDAGSARCAAHPGSDLQQPAITNAQKEKDSPYEVVNVQVAMRDVMKRPNAIADRMSDDADNHERDEKREGSDEQPLAPRLSHVLAVNLLQSTVADRGEYKPQS